MPSSGTFIFGFVHYLVCLVLVKVLKNAKHVDEELNNVHVEIQSSENIFFWTERVLVSAAHHDLRVIHDVHREDHCTNACHEEVGELGAEKESNDDRSNREDQQDNAECAAHRGDIVLGLEREQCESNDNRSCDADGHQHNLGFVDRRDEANDNRLAKCKCAEKNNVCW